MSLPAPLEAALRYYVGEWQALPALPPDPKAYCTLNALFFPGLATERARAAEGRRLNPAFALRWEDTLGLCRALLSALQWGGQGQPPERLYRVERQTDADLMRRAGSTLSFTSTSRAGFLSGYTDKSRLVLLTVLLPADAPRADMERLLSRYMKPEEAEVLLPPWLPLRFEKRPLTQAEAALRDRDGAPPVAAYTVTAAACAQPPRGGCGLPEGGSEAAVRVYAALNAGREPEAADISLYLRWKSALTGLLGEETNRPRG